MRQISEVQQSSIEDHSAWHCARMHTVLVPLVSFPDMSKVENHEALLFRYLFLHLPDLRHAHVNEPVNKSGRIATHY